MQNSTAQVPMAQGAGIIGQEPRKKRKLFIWRLIVIVLPVLVILSAVGATVAMSAFAPEPEETEDPIKALPVLTKRAQLGSVTLQVKAQGEVQPRTEINVVNQVGGRITYMSPTFIEGGKFSKGDLLVRIDPAEYRLRVTQAKANVSQAETVLAREKSESEVARMDWEELGRGGTPTPLTLREPQMAEAAAQLEAAKAGLAEAELQLSRTELRAPFDGRVLERLVDSGEFVGLNTRLGRIYATNIMDVRLPLTQSDLRQTGLYLGYEKGGEDTVPVTLSANVAGENATWAGIIARTDSRFDPQSRVLHVYAEVEQPFGSENKAPLAPGLFVEADIAGPKLENVILVPRTALRGEDEVYIANDDGTLSIKQVEVLSSDRNRVVIGSGLSAGERVVTSPIRGAAEGMKIEEVETLASKTLPEAGVKS